MLPTALIPCSSELDNKIDVTAMIKSGLLSHPCNRNIIATFKDSPALLHCNSIIYRIWTFTDNCGQSTTFQQLIKVLSLQEPIQPKDGELNVNLRPLLLWSTYPNTNKYKLYVWKFQEARKDSFLTLYSNSYFPNVKNAFPPDSQMLWQVEFVLNAGHLVNNLSVIPSPVWGFATTKVPDFKVVLVSVPTAVFTGRTFQVSWNVVNIGSRGNFRSVWYDRVFLTKDINSNSGFLVSTIRRQGFLFPNDGYTGKVTLQVPNDMDTGKYYAILWTDYYVNTQDVDSSNNRGVSSSFITIRLTPPPDLQVDSVVIPTTSISGKFYIFLKIQPLNFRSAFSIC